MAKAVLSHPGCGPFVQNAARALHEAGLLSCYVTTFAYRPQAPLGRLLRAGLRPFVHDPHAQLSRRAVTEVPDSMLRTHPLPEILRMAAAKTASSITADRVWEITEKWFDRIVARQHLQGTDVVYAYEHAALETFRVQKERGGFCIYDMPICHHQAREHWIGSEYRKTPHLFTAYDRHRVELAPTRNLRKDAELSLADRVIAASRFVRDSLVEAGVAPGKIWVIPSGAPPVDISRRQPDPARFVFLAAGHLSVRKGTHYLLEAWRKLNPGSDVELWMVGSWQLPESMRRDLPGTVRIKGHVSREELYRMFDRANVLVFPTLAEGLALTPLQAMSRGLPVITTPNSGADSFIETGKNGVLIAPANIDALIAAMRQAIAMREELQKLGDAAAVTMAGWQWSDYRAELGRQVQDWISTGSRETEVAVGCSLR